MFDEAESAHVIAVRNVFEAHRIIAEQKARISALKTADHTTRGHEQLLEILERRLRSLRMMSASSEPHATEHDRPPLPAALVRRGNGRLLHREGSDGALTGL